MDGSSFPGGVVVGQADMQRVETQASFHIRQRQRDMGAAGAIVSGMQVQRNGVNLATVNVISGTAYAPNGEYIELLSTQTLLPLADYTDLAVNLVLAVYYETASNLRPHETDGTQRTTSTARAVRIEVVTLAQYNALPQTAADYVTTALDRALVLAQVLGNGFTGSTPNALVVGEITQEAALAVLSIGARLFDGPSITGVQIRSISQSTVITEPATNGTLDFDPVGAAGNPGLRWTSPTPGDTPGSYVNVSAGGGFTLASGGAYQLTVYVVPELLPVLSISTFVEVSREYSWQRGAQLSTPDNLHRSLLGDNLAPYPDNPHGVTPINMGAMLEVPQLIADLGRLFLGTDAHARVPRVFGRNRAAAWTQFEQLATTTTGNYFHRYVDDSGDMYLVVGAHRRAADWALDTGVAFAVGLVLGGGGAITRIVYQNTATFASWLDLAAFSFGASGAVRIGDGLLSTNVLSIVPRLTANYFQSTADRTLLLQSRSNSGANTGVLNVYRCHVPNGGPTAAEGAFNATWSNASALWTQNDGALDSVLWRYSTSGLTIFRQQGGSAPWADSAWTTTSVNLVAATGVMNAQGFGFLTPPTFRCTVPGASAQFDTASALVGVFNRVAFGDPESLAGQIAFIKSSTANALGALWPLTLPQGAVITGGRLHGDWDNNGGQLRASIIRIARSAGTILSMRTGTSYDTVSTGTNADFTLTANESAGNRTVDNAEFSYAIWLGNDTTTPGPQTEIVACWHVECDYTMSVLAW